MTRDEARSRFSDYLEDALDSRERDEMQAFLASAPDCAAELFAMERTLSLLHRLPPREPVLDIWREFLPRIEEFRAERRLGGLPHLRLQWEQVRAQMSDGIILWTHALSERAKARLGRYLWHNHHWKFHSHEGQE